MLGHSDGLLSGMCGLGGGGGETLSLSESIRYLPNTVDSVGHSRCCPAYAESEQASVNTTQVTQQKCCVSFG